MSDSGEDQETYSGHIMKKQQWVYIKIKCLEGNTVPIITANLDSAYAWLFFNVRICVTSSDH